MKCFKSLKDASKNFSVLASAFLVMLAVSMMVGLLMISEMNSLKSKLHEQKIELEAVMSIESRKTAFVTEYRAKILDKFPKTKEFDLAVMLAQVFDVCERFRVKQKRIIAIIQQESNFYKFAKGSSGEDGYMQLMPGTANLLAGYLDMPDYDVIRDNIILGVAYYSILDRAYPDSRAIASYNGGERNWHKPAPRKYAKTVLAIEKSY